jgi:hypothetical protein
MEESNEKIQAEKVRLNQKVESMQNQIDQLQFDQEI